MRELAAHLFVSLDGFAWSGVSGPTLDSQGRNTRNGSTAISIVLRELILERVTCRTMSEFSSMSTDEVSTSNERPPETGLPEHAS
jgi:hypothetical protein